LIKISHERGFLDEFWALSCKMLELFPQGYPHYFRF